MIKDWEQRKLRDLAEQLEYGLNASAMEYDGKNKYIRITDIDDENHKFVKSSLTSPNTELNSSDNFLLKEGDILFARTGASVGKTYIYDSNDGKVYYAGFLIRARINDSTNPEFIFQNTLTKKYNNFVRITSQRSGQPGINATEYKNYDISLPKIKEQEDISEFLKSMDNLVVLHQRKNQILEMIKKMFVREMLPRHLEKTPNIIFRNINSDWKKDKAKEIFSPITEKNQEELPVLSISQEEGVIYRKDVGKNIQYDPNTLKNYKVVRPDNFIISLRSFQGGFELSNISGITSPAYTVFALKDRSKNDNEFWRTYFKSYKFIESLKKVTFGIRDGRSISYSEFSSLNLSYPSTKHEQNTIGLFFKRIDKIIAINQNKIRKLQYLKSSYLRKMFL